MILEDNTVVEVILPSSVLRDLTDEEMYEYRRPYKNRGEASRPSTAVYLPRRPEKTVVYQVVQQHLETWLAQAREADPNSDPIRRFVERDLRYPHYKSFYE